MFGNKNRAKNIRKVTDGYITNSVKSKEEDLDMNEEEKKLDTEVGNTVLKGSSAFSQYDVVSEHSDDLKDKSAEPEVQEVIEDEPENIQDIDELLNELDINVSTQEPETQLIKADIVKDIADVNDMETLPCTVIQTETVKLDIINDPNGYVSDKIDAVEDRLGLPVLPLDLIGVPDTVVNLQRHNIVRIGDRRYSSSTSRLVNTDGLNAISSEIVSKLSRLEESILIPITVNVTVSGNSFKTYLFNTKELETLLGKFRNYNPEIKIDKNNNCYFYCSAFKSII